MQLRIDHIKIPLRIRKDLGDIRRLMLSLEQYGLMNPIVVNRKHELIAGHRRLEAARRLGWDCIEAHVVNKAAALDKLLLEIEENVQRKDLTGEELDAARARLEKLRNPGLLRRMFRACGRFFKRLFALERHNE